MILMKLPGLQELPVGHHHLMNACEGLLADLLISPWWTRHDCHEDILGGRLTRANSTVTLKDLLALRVEPRELAQVVTDDCDSGGFF